MGEVKLVDRASSDVLRERVGVAVRIKDICDALQCIARFGINHYLMFV